MGGFGTFGINSDGDSADQFDERFDGNRQCFRVASCSWLCPIISILGKSLQYIKR